MRHQRSLLVVAGGLIALGLVLVHAALTPTQAPLTQKDIDAAVLHTLENVQFPSHAAKAYEAVQRSVVRVRGRANSEREDGYATEGVGTGVVIVDTGIILTNMHVVAGADQVQVEFFDGLESEATVIGIRPEHDLAVLQAKKLPDDLPAATLRSTADLAIGDEVVAVGFPFGIGPSVSSGVVSGLRREYRSPQGKRRADQSHPVRRRGQSRQFRRAPRHRGRGSRGDRHGHTQPDGAERLHRDRVRGADRERGRRRRHFAILMSDQRGQEPMNDSATPVAPT